MKARWIAAVFGLVLLAVGFFLSSVGDPVEEQPCCPLPDAADEPGGIPQLQPVKEEEDLPPPSAPVQLGGPEMAAEDTPSTP